MIEKLGINTTDGVSRLKTKTTEGVTKAVECACCNPCDPNALWGPGYDTKPETLDVLGHTIYRVESCRWQIWSCLNPNGIGFYWDSAYDGNCDFYDFFIKLEYSPVYTTQGPKLMYYMEDFAGDYIRTGGAHPFPYGVYTYDESLWSPPPEIPLTITISPPA